MTRHDITASGVLETDFVSKSTMTIVRVKRRLGVQSSTQRVFNVRVVIVRI